MFNALWLKFYFDTKTEIPCYCFHLPSTLLPVALFLGFLNYFVLDLFLLFLAVFKIFLLGGGVCGEGV